ncbi:RNA ligase family protein [Actinocorallia libanotica]|uniref:RNA ligase domain-containing protein n=1 Tax=Actinocorallia libanotica TaxID=46162 RepID=A0ABP4BCW1_9ACTN
MRFRQFPKLPEAAPPDSPAGEWIAFEKVHGAQLVLGRGADGTVRFGKRKAWLADGEPFFGWQVLRRRLTDAMHEIASLVPGAEKRDLVVYSELHGGGYPHPAVPALASADPVQTGIWYGPELRVAAFAILLAAPGEGDGELLAPSEMELAVDGRPGIGAVPAVARGEAHRRVAELPVLRPPAAPGRDGLPVIEGNVAEGLVLWPDRRSSLGGLRAWKRKIPQMRDETFDRSVPFDPRRPVPPAELGELAARMVGGVRLAGARSKTGDDPALVLDELVLDVLTDLETALPAGIAALSPADLDLLTERIRRAAGRYGDRPSG